MASSTADGEDDSPAQEIQLVNSGELWVATDVETGVTSQGETREAALANLDEAVALHRGEIGRQPTDEELRDLGIDPADNVTGTEEPPDVLDSSE
jgi:predicted RNase H-like HicB family nuclease